jgi:hypothetical protein
MWDYVDFSAYHDASALVMSTVQYYVVTASQGPQRANTGLDRTTDFTSACTSWYAGDMRAA